MLLPRIGTRRAGGMGTSSAHRKDVTSGCQTRGMDSADYLDHLAREGAAFAAAAEAGLDRPVPTCPGWDVAALVAHLGQVHG
ncbi:MAG: maleylpyruvate isomerase N-terminal domain-containing protein, partial [Acidimicrobiales bacterium]